MSGEGRDEFRWQAFFQRTSDPIFVLNRRLRLLFINRALEDLTGLPVAQARGIVCSRRKPSEPGLWPELLAHLLCPPPEVRHGKPARTRRLVPGAPPERRWWDVDFLPLCDEHGLRGVFGKVTVVPAAPTSTGPPVPEKLIALRERAFGRYTFASLSSTSPAVRRVAGQARLAAQTHVPALLVGEAGTGKRWLARLIHAQGPGRERTFAALDCGALPAEALAATLFGDGGLARQPGVGTLYLLDPAQMPRDLQARLAEWLAVTDDAGPRILAGARTEPADDVHTGRLLEDLYGVLATLVLTLPPLRARSDDLPALVEYCLERANSDDEQRIAGLTPAAWQLLHSYRWPGNLRELYAVVQGARLHARGERIDAADLPAYVRLAVRLDRTPGAETSKPLALDKILEEAERRLIVQALHKAQGNKSKTAEMLSIWRARLLRRMEALGIADTEGEKKKL